MIRREQNPLILICILMALILASCEDPDPVFEQPPTTSTLDRRHT
jgi:hypothetical protein